VETFEINKNTNIELEYNFIHNDSNKTADIAYLNDNKLEYIFEICHSHKTVNDDRPEPWFEFNARDVINVTDNIFRCIRNNCNCYVGNPGKIYFNQRGAGCGKTFESIRLLNGDDRFNDKNTFVYLSKLHSAKDVIFNELKYQEKNNYIRSLNMNITNVGKQYLIQFENYKGKQITVIIGTLDSFYFNLCKSRDIKEFDYFQGIKNNIIKGDTNIDSNNSFTYAGKYIKLSDTLVIVDEAQDLKDDNINVFKDIINVNSLDLYVIGDKLQSIWGENNVYNYVEMISSEINIIKDTGVNKVMRFHNSKFINFVNTLVPFNNYGLPPVTEICDGNCRYEHEDSDPYHYLGNCPNIYDCKENEYNPFIRKITTVMDNEIRQHNYLPNNFMFIFPYMKGNVLAEFILEELQKYWIAKFNDDDYKTQVLHKDEYWKNLTNIDSYRQYIYLHKSEENKPIDLSESEYASRILTIHASKGNGCEVVFLLGLDEKSLRTFTRDQYTNLLYDSLLHVAITRQKKSLYISISSRTYDDIVKKFRNIFNDIDIDELPSIKNSILIGEDDIKNKDILTNLHYNDIPVNENTKKFLINWEHHVLRNHVFNIIIKLELFNNHQTWAIIKSIPNKEILECYDYVTYRNYGNDPQIEFRDRKNKYIPIMIHTTNNIYYKYVSLLKLIIKNIQQKINDSDYKFCVLEYVILSYIFYHSLYHTTKDNSISPTEIYSLMDYLLNTKSVEFVNCCCHSNNINSVDNKLTNHYNMLKQVREIKPKYYDLIYSNGLKHLHNKKLVIQHDNILIKRILSHIAVSNDMIINIMVYPQFNNLNKPKVIVESLLDTYFIMKNNDGKNNQYSNDDIYHCIISMDSSNIVLFKLDISKSNDTIKDTIRNALYNKNNSDNKYIENELKKSLNIDILLKEDTPNYIEHFLRNIKYKCVKYENNEVKMKKFLTKINQNNYISNKLGKESKIFADKLIDTL